MGFYKIYFSPTGGTKKVVDIIGSVWNRKGEEIDLMKRDEEKEYRFQPEDLCIVAVPSFGGRVPQTALEQLGRMSGGGARVILTAVYGNRDFDDTLLELKETLSRAGFFCAAAVAAVAEHSIIHKFGAGRPDAQDAKQLREFAGQIKEMLNRPDEKEEVQVRGNYPYREYHGVPMKPKADKNCIKCGRCVAECPVHAIPKKNPTSVNKERCISCMHCIAVCPKKARQNGKLLLAMAEQKMKKSCSTRKENQLFI